MANDLLEEYTAMKAVVDQKVASLAKEAQPDMGLQPGDFIVNLEDRKGETLAPARRDHEETQSQVAEVGEAEQPRSQLQKERGVTRRRSELVGSLARLAAPGEPFPRSDEGAICGRGA